MQRSLINDKNFVNPDVVNIKGAPKDKGYTKISSTYGTFAALKVNGSITAWGWKGVDGSKNAPLPRDS
jgi:hypothetical protein